MSQTSDLTFRRHFLVQALIIAEFLLSLTAEAKEKMATVAVQNKSVMYSDHVLNDDDAKWLVAMRKGIHEYVRNSNHDGPYFMRMVDTILARDKNWVRWKVESCPSIELPAITAKAFADAKDAARRAFSNKRMRPTPVGSLSLDFLGDGNDEAAMEWLKSSDRYGLPALESFKNLIAEEDLEIEMPSNDKSKADAVERKASKTWRALRIARRRRLAAFDKIDDDNSIDPVFSDEKGPSRAADPDKVPTDTRPIVLSGPHGVGKSSLLGKLRERNPDVFDEVLQHTTRADAKGDRYHVVDAKSFQVMLDGDRFVESSEVDGHQYGTSRGLVDRVSEAGQVPLIRMDRAVSRPCSTSPREMPFTNRASTSRASRWPRRWRTRRASCSSSRRIPRPWKQGFGKGGGRRTRRGHLWHVRPRTWSMGGRERSTRSLSTTIWTPPPLAWRPLSTGPARTRPSRTEFPRWTGGRKAWRPPRATVRRPKAGTEASSESRRVRVETVGVLLVCHTIRVQESFASQGPGGLETCQIIGGQPTEAKQQESVCHEMVGPMPRGNLALTQ